MKFFYIGFFILVSACFFLSCKKHADYVPVYVKNEIPENVDGSIIDFRVEEYKEKSLSWDLTARRAWLLRNNAGTILKNFELKYYKNGQLSNNAQGQEGILDSQKKTLNISGEVVVTSKSGRKINGSNVLWDEKTGKISSSSPVKILLETGDIIRANAFEADQNLEKITLKKGKGYHPSKENE